MMIPDHDREILSKAVCLPFLIKVLQRDLKVVEVNPFKFKGPYMVVIEELMKVIKKDLAEVKRYLYKNNIKIVYVGKDETSTNYLFLYNGFEEKTNYFNPHLGNKVEEMLREYMNGGQSKNSDPSI
ncbi:hypothetical protein [Bacillus sp. FSL K6-3431]|uniref:hypothetical protein n=1 Tax=Bacillus sp. FSL K6-3431 TaxID=2921500 RepID=UPI0030F6D9E2